MSVALTHTGPRESWQRFVFPPLPDILPEDDTHALLRRWLDDHAPAMGGLMYEFSVSSRTREVRFNVLIRQPGARGSGKIAGAWDAAGLLARVKTSFAKAVNDELEAMGLPRSYAVP